MKKLSWLVAILIICFYTGVEAAAGMPQSETGKEIAIAISKTHGIWGGFIDYAVLVAMVFTFLSLFCIWYVHYEIWQRLKRLESHFQEVVHDTNQANITIHAPSIDSGDVYAMQEKIKSLEDKVSSLEKTISAALTESRNKPNANTGTEATHINESLNAYNHSLGECQHDTMPYDETKAEDFIREYNALYDMREAMEKKRKQTALENDSLLRRFSCSNNNERLYNPDIEPIFKSSQNGEYIAYDVGNNHYAVLPAYAAYEKTRHVMYAMGDVFDSNYEGEAYTKIEVVKPAIFVVSDDKWNLDRKGKLVLKK